MRKKFSSFYTPVVEKDEHKKTKEYKKLSPKMRNAVDDIFKKMDTKPSDFLNTFDKTINMVSKKYKVPEKELMGYFEKKMALKLIRHCGTITASTLGDDAAHGIALGKLGNGNAFRVSEFAGKDVFIKVTSISDSTAVTSSNGLYLRASNTVNIVPEGNRSPIVGGDTGVRVALDGTDTDSSDAGDIVRLEDEASGGAV